METSTHHQVTDYPGWTLIPTHYSRNARGCCVFIERTVSHARLLAPARARREMEEARVHA